MEPPPIAAALAQTAQQLALRAPNQLPPSAAEGLGAQGDPAAQTGSKRARTGEIPDSNHRANVPAPAANEPQADNTAARQLHWFNIKPDLEHATFSAEKLINITGQDILATIILRMTEIQTELDPEFPMKFEQSNLNTDTIKIDL